MPLDELPAKPGNPFLNKLMQSFLRRQVPHTVPDPNVADIYYEEVRLVGEDDPVRGPYVMPLVTLRTNPCRWSTSAGCVMCGYHLGANRDPVTESNLIAQTQNAIDRLNPSTYPAIVFTSNGSFLDSAEVPDQVRVILLGMLRDAGFKLVVVESRPEYITQKRLQEMAQAFPRTDPTQSAVPISVSFGLESVNDFVQKYCINKGRRRTDYIEAFELLSEEGFHYDCYVLLGKPFMSAREDVEDAIDTIKFAVDNGSEYVFVMVTNMVEFGLTHYLAEKGRYKLPSLWRAVELLERLPWEYRSAVQIKGISHAPVAPKFYAQTCECCTEHVKGCLNFWNQTGEFEHIRSIYPCDCREEFETTEWAVSDSFSLSERVYSEYSLLCDEFSIDPRLLPDRTDLRRHLELSGL